MQLSKANLFSLHCKVFEVLFRMLISFRSSLPQFKVILHSEGPKGLTLLSKIKRCANKKGNSVVGSSALSYFVLIYLWVLKVRKPRKQICENMQLMKANIDIKCCFVLHGKHDTIFIFFGLNSVPPLYLNLLLYWTFVSPFLN